MLCLGAFEGFFIANSEIYRGVVLRCCWEPLLADAISVRLVQSWPETRI